MRKDPLFPADPSRCYKEANMEKNKLLTSSALLFSLFLTSCQSVQTEGQITDVEVDKKYLVERNDQKGSVETLSYETKDYVFPSGKKEEKKCAVYLPYGYDSKEQYNVLYLIHGTDKQSVNHLETWFENIKARVMLDNLIYYKVIDPLIVVCPTFYSYGLFGDDDRKNIKDYSFVKENSNKNFLNELRYDIVPSVEAQYATYSVTRDEQGLSSSRDHRAIAGLSNGCRLTLNAGRIYNFDYFSYFGCYSSFVHSSDIISSLTSEKFKDYKLNYRFNADGIYDFAYHEHRKRVNELLDDSHHIFTEKNTEYVKIRRGYHSARSWRVGLYDSLLRFFQ